MEWNICILKNVHAYVKVNGKNVWKFQIVWGCKTRMCNACCLFHVQSVYGWLDFETGAVRPWYRSLRFFSLGKHTAVPVAIWFLSLMLCFTEVKYNIPLMKRTFSCHMSIRERTFVYWKVSSSHGSVGIIVIMKVLMNQPFLKLQYFPQNLKMRHVYWCWCNCVSPTWLCWPTGESCPGEGLVD